MKNKRRNSKELLRENEGLRIRAEQAEAALEASFKGEVDAIISPTSGKAILSTLPSIAYISRIFIEEMAEGAIVTDDKGTINYCNGSCAKFLGRSKSELIGLNLSAFVAEVSKDHYNSYFGNPVKRKEIFPELYLLTRKSGEVPVTLSITPLDYQDISQLCITLYDLREERHREQQIVEERDKFETLFDSIRDAILVANTERCIINCNTAFSRIFGYTLEEIRGQHTYYIYESKDQFEEMGRALKKNFNEFEPFLYTVNYRKKSGEVFPGETGVYYLKDEQGAVNGFIGLIRDITARRAAENALKSSEAFQRALISASPVAIHGVDKDDKIIFWNESCERIFGWSANEVLGKPLPTIPEDQIQEHLTLLKKVLSGEHLSDIQVERVRKSGERFFGSFSAAPLYDNQAALQGMVATIADITEQKKMEEQLRLTQKLEAVGRLAGGIAHDFNNMLMIIKGFSQIVRNKIDPEAVEYDHLLEIEKAVKRGADLTQQLLAYGRKQELDVENVDINTIFESSKKMLEHLIGENITIRMIPDHTVPLIRADVNQLHQIVINLATNARDAMPAGGSLEYLVERAEFGSTVEGSSRIIAPGTYVLLRVRDTGEGIDEELLPHLFEPFFTTKKIGEGTGLGLATIYGTVKQLNGYIFCTSEKGAGAEFSLYFPAVESGELKIREPETLPRSFSGNETILLVEDEEMVRRTLSLILHGKGYNVLEAVDSSSAWEIYQERKDEIDLLISDVIMPGESGIVLAKKINAETPSLKMILLSGYSETGMGSLEELTNQWRSFQKPIEPDILIYEVRKLLDLQE